MAGIDSLTWFCTVRSFCSHFLSRTQARNFAVMTGVNSGVAAFMKRWRGKEDVQNQLVGESCWLETGLLCSMESKSPMLVATSGGRAEPASG